MVLSSWLVAVGGETPSWSSPLRRGGGVQLPGPRRKGEEGGSSRDLPGTAVEFCPDRPVQHRRGYAAMPLIQHQVVDLHPWLTMTQFADVIAIAEMTPAPSPLNAATFVGIQVAASPGPWWPRRGACCPPASSCFRWPSCTISSRGFSVIQGILAGGAAGGGGHDRLGGGVHGAAGRCTAPDPAGGPTAVQWTAVGHSGRGAGGAAGSEGESGLGHSRLRPRRNPSGNFVRGEGGWRFVRGGSVRGVKHSVWFEAPYKNWMHPEPYP